jgi:DNA-binding response OmpR family regulator
MAQRNPAPPKILVVDDDVRLRDLLSRYLTEQGREGASLAGARFAAPARTCRSSC